MRSSLLIELPRIAPLLLWFVAEAVKLDVSEAQAAETAENSALGAMIALVVKAGLACAGLAAAAIPAAAVQQMAEMNDLPRMRPN